MGEFDVESLLRNGYWPNSKLKSTDPVKIPDTTHKSSYTYRDDNYAYRDDRAVPRNTTYHFSTRKPKPPSPSVEDELDALAKEAGSILSIVSSEEPPNRGDPDQYPIILPVEEYAHEYNPERRFVLVSGTTDPSSVEGGSNKTNPEPASYEANTGRRYGSALDHEKETEKETDKKEEIKPQAEHIRHRPVDLPPIVTDEARSHDARRARSAATEGRTEGRREEPYSARLSSTTSATPRENFLSPDVIEHATHGRDRQFYRGESSSGSQARNRSAHPSNHQYSQSSATGYSYDEKESRSARSSGPTKHKRHTSELPQRSRYDYDTSSQYSPTKKGTRPPPQYNDTFYSSEDEARSQATRQKRSARPEEDNQYLTTPIESRSGNRRKSRGQSSSSTRPYQSSLLDQYANPPSSRSATFPRDSSVSTRDDDHTERTHSRTSTLRDSFSAARSAIPDIVAAAVTSSLTAAATSDVKSSSDYGRSAVPPSPRVSPHADSRAQSSNQPAWRPPKFEPPQSQESSSGGGLQRPINSYRRYSTEVKVGELPDIPHCPRTRPEAGHMDWLTLPRCDNFNICPSCYSANFASTEFAHDFVLMPFRPRDRALACDFGASEFYRIAWLFTRKYRRTDLGLLQSLTKLAAQTEPCSGHREASRLWYSVRDPATKRPVDGLTVCGACANAVEILLPGLMGIFVPAADGPAERTRSVCALYHDLGPDRGRFLLYFDAMEAAADRALETRTAPDIQALADRMRQLAAVPPCPGERGGALTGAHWQASSALDPTAPLVACAECYMTVVQPLLDDGDDATVAGNFRPVAGPRKDGLGCMLYSDRMRSVFHRAVRRRDMAYLEAKVAERLEKSREYDALAAGQQRRGQRTSWIDDDERILREWKRYE